MKTNLILICLLLAFAGCRKKIDAPLPATDAGTVGFDEYCALEASHPKGNVKWVVPTFEEMRQCTDEEMLNMTIFCTLGQSAKTVEDFEWVGNKYMPKRFKIEDPKNGKVVTE